MDETNLIIQIKEWVDKHYHYASLSHKSAFACSVIYLVSGASIGLGGPSCREHLCSLRLAGESVESDSPVTMFFIDPKYPLPGDWELEDAMEFCAPLCFSPASEFREELISILNNEDCFDDDPADIEALTGKVVQEERGWRFEQQLPLTPKLNAALIRQVSQILGTEKICHGTVGKYHACCKVLSPQARGLFCKRHRAQDEKQKQRVRDARKNYRN